MASIQPKTWVEIDRQALTHNIKQFRNIIDPSVKLLLAVKSNAYGHGLQEMSKIAVSEGVDWLGVDSLEEAIVLREAEIDIPILVLGYVLESNLKEAITHNLRLTVYNPEIIETLGSLGRPAKIHLKIETGTSRQGIIPSELDKIIELIKKYPQIEIEGISTHFANIEDTTDYTYAEKQLDVFGKTTANLDVPIRHVANSAATMLFPKTHFDMVRIGISSYGFWPSKETKGVIKERNGKHSSGISLQRAFTWKTVVVQIKDICKGTAVSYGCTEKVKRASRIAVLPVGYWDGFDRKLSRTGEVLIDGQRCKVLGRVCMNMIVVDVSDCQDVKLEDEAVIIGEQGDEEITADELAEKIGSINYEVVARVNPLIMRKIV